MKIVGIAARGRYDTKAFLVGLWCKYLALFGMEEDCQRYWHQKALKRDQYRILDRCLLIAED